MFLPDYSEVIELRDRIAAMSLRRRLQVHTLHEHILLVDYRKLFLPAGHGLRKVILTTSLAESAVSFDDVICVIDTGLMRPVEDDAVVSCSPPSRWISQVVFSSTIWFLVLLGCCN